MSRERTLYQRLVIIANAAKRSGLSVYGVSVMYLAPDDVAAAESYVCQSTGWKRAVQNWIGVEHHYPNEITDVWRVTIHGIDFALYFSRPATDEERAAKKAENERRTENAV